MFDFTHMYRLQYIIYIRTCTDRYELFTYMLIRYLNNYNLSIKSFQNFFSSRGSSKSKNSVPSSLGWCAYFLLPEVSGREVYPDGYFRGKNDRRKYISGSPSLKHLCLAFFFLLPLGREVYPELNFQ